MEKNIYRYEFAEVLDVTEVEATITLALMATESLHGEPRVRLEARYSFDSASRTCVIDAGGEVGRDLNRLFLGFVSREFGRDSFSVRPLSEWPQLTTPATAA